MNWPCALALAEGGMYYTVYMGRMTTGNALAPRIHRIDYGEWSSVEYGTNIT